MSRANKAKRSAVEALAKLYALVPMVPCKGLCRDSCGAIAECCGPLETELAAREAKVEPREAFLGIINLLSDGSCQACPLLTAGGLCQAYKARPLICRLWGAVDAENMRCPWGCRPFVYLTDLQSRTLLARLQEIEERYQKELVS